MEPLKLMQDKKQIVVIGEVLFDIYPEFSLRRIGGAPFNFAYHLQAIGCHTNFISRIGDDQLGKSIHGLLHAAGFPDNYIQKDPEHPTGQVEVHTGAKGTPEFTIIDSCAYDFIEWRPEIAALFTGAPQVDMVYYGTLSQRQPTTRATIERLLAASGNCLKFCDINLRSPFYNREIMETALEHCDILKLNDDEFAILGDYFSLDANQEQAIAQLCAKFAITTLCLTQGSRGSLLFREGNITRHVVEPQQVIDSVGAGDAYSAILCLGLLQQWPLPQILASASQFALAICAIKGAIPEDRKFYQQQLMNLKLGEKN